MTQPTPEGVIPYVDHHTGPKRYVSVTLETTGANPMKGYAASMVAPNLFVDGRQYIVYWGRVTVEVPADRAVHLGVGMQDGMRGASMLLPPGPEPLDLSYQVSSFGPATFGVVPPAR